MTNEEKIKCMRLFLKTFEKDVRDVKVRYSSTYGIFVHVSFFEQDSNAQLFWRRAFIKNKVHGFYVPFEMDAKEAKKFVEEIESALTQKFGGEIEPAPALTKIYYSVEFLNGPIFSE